MRVIWCAIVSFSLIASWLGEGTAATASDGQTHLSTPSPKLVPSRRDDHEQAVRIAPDLLAMPNPVRAITVAPAADPVVPPELARHAAARPRAPPT
jgi:hypothetical protein